MTDNFGYGPIVPLDKFMPDGTLFGPHLTKAKNTYFYDGAYRGVPSLSPASAIPLPATSGRYVHGNFFLANGSLYNILGSERRLYIVNQGSVIDISRNNEDYSSSSYWRSVQWEDDVLLTNGKNPIQIYHTQGGGQCSNLSPDAPIAEHFAVVNNQLFVANGNTVYASEFGVLDVWDDANVGAIQQEVEHGGRINGIIGGERAIVFHAEALDIWTPTDSELGFRRDRIYNSLGLAAPESLIEVEGHYYFYSNYGFVRLSPDDISFSVGDIGKGYVDQKVQEIHGRRANLMRAIHDPRRRLIYFGVPTQDNQLMDKLYVYSYAEDRWSEMEFGDLVPQLIWQTRDAPINLDSTAIATRTYGNIAERFGSLRYRSGEKEMVAICDVAGVPNICHFTGETMEAELETGVVPPDDFIGEETDPPDRGAIVKRGHRSYVNSVSVIGDVGRMGIRLLAGDYIREEGCLTEREVKERLDNIQERINSERARVPPNQSRIRQLKNDYNNWNRAVICHEEVVERIEGRFPVAGSGKFVGLNIKVYEGFEYILAYRMAVRDDGSGDL